MLGSCVLGSGSNTQLISNFMTLSGSDRHFQLYVVVLLVTDLFTVWDEVFRILEKMPSE